MNPKELDSVLDRVRLARCMDLIENKSHNITLVLPGPNERTIVEAICHEMIQLGRELERSVTSSFAIATPEDALVTKGKNVKIRKRRRK